MTITAGNEGTPVTPTPFSDAALRTRSAPTAPVPAVALGPRIPDEGYVMEEIAAGIFWLGDGSYQMMFAVTDDGVVAVDAPPTLGHNILRAIKRVTTEPISHVVYSHQHSDHVGAMSIYPENAPRYAHRITADRLRSLNDPHRPVPTIEFHDQFVLDVGTNSMKLDYQGPNHAEGNIFIHVPEAKVLMLVDVIFPGWVPFSNLALSANVPGFIRAHEQTLGYDFETLVSGHVTRTGNREDVAVQLDYMNDLRSTTEKALSSVNLGTTMGPVDASNVWAVFRAYLDAVAAAAADDLVPRWIDRLGGADVFTLPNAWAMAESHRLDLNSMGPFGTVA